MYQAALVDRDLSAAGFSAILRVKQSRAITNNCYINGGRKNQGRRRNLPAILGDKRRRITGL